MTIKIQSGRQFAAGDASVALFDEKGKAGSYLQKASDKLVAQQVTVQLKGARNKTITLATADDWKGFLGKYAANETEAKAFKTHFGITFSDFCNTVDDAAASDDKGLTLDLRPTSELSKTLSLDKVDGDYASKMTAGQQVNLTGANGAKGVAEAAGPGPKIGPEILATPIASDWERDRSEQESWADFKNGNTERDTFKANTGPAAFGKLYQPKWDDPKAMEMVNKFSMPLHLEVKGSNPDGTTKFQDGYEMFRDTYYDDKNGSLDKAGASVRARVRFDNNPPFNVNRVLVQAKEGRVIDGDNSAVHKFEKRWEGNFTDETKAQGLLVSGKEENGQPLAVAQKLYKLASDKKTLPADGNLALEPKYELLQKRRRTHLQLDTASEVQTRRAALQPEIDKYKTANQPVPPALQAYADKMDSQVKFLNDSSALLQKYGQYQPSGECFIVSADQYSVYDPVARKGNPPTDVSDEAGRIGRGPLHIEAEWDSNSSDPYEKAIDEATKKLAADPANAAAYKADIASLEGMRTTFRKDVAATVEVTRDQLLNAGLKEDPSKMAKEDHAAEIAKGKDRPVFWL